MSAAREIYIKQLEFYASVEKHLEKLGWECDKFGLWSRGEQKELRTIQACDVEISANIGEIMNELNQGFL